MNNASKIWKGINSFLSFKPRNSQGDISLEIDGKIISDPTQIANKLNSFFSSIAEKLRTKIPRTPKTFREFLTNPNPHSIFLSPIHAEEILDCLNSLDCRKGYGPSSIPPRIIKLIKTEISHPLSKIFNLCFSSGTFPNILKIAKVLPIHKKGSMTDFNNYRPISLLSNLDKVLEKLIYKCVYGFLSDHKILFTNQFGFRRGHSTVHTLLNMCQQVADALDEHKLACGVFVDLQKAFDTVDHDILLAKLYHYGIRGKVHSLFRSYLTGRRQFVSILGKKSSESFMLHGVPQGSVLGPLLFLIYVNDLHCAIKFSIINHFADDTNILCLRGLCTIRLKVF